MQREDKEKIDALFVESVKNIMRDYGVSKYAITRDADLNPSQFWNVINESDRGIHASPKMIRNVARLYPEYMKQVQIMYVKFSAKDVGLKLNIK